MNDIMLVGEQNWPLGVIGLAIAVWEIVSRREGGRWQVRLLAVAGAGWLVTSAWAAERSEPGVDPSWPILVNLIWPIAVLPYVGLRAEEAMR